MASLVVCATPIGLCGRASGKETAGTRPAKEAKPHMVKRSKAGGLSAGMTMNQVVQAIGKPWSKSVNHQDPEIWKAMFISFHSESGGKTCILTVVFDTDDKVKSWSSSSQRVY